MFWLQNPLLILKEKKYPIPQNSAKIFENSDILLILIDFIEDEDFIDFLTVNTRNILIFSKISRNLLLAQ